MDTQRRSPGWSDGPTLEQYVETRLNLLLKQVESVERAVRERIDAVEKSGVVAQTSADRISDKVEAAQKEHNIASNNWRAEYNQLKSETAPLTELRRIEREFAAYRLEVNTLFASQMGAKSNAKETKEAGTAQMGLIVAAVSVVVSVIMSIALAFFQKVP